LRPAYLAHFYFTGLACGIARSFASRARLAKIRAETSVSQLRLAKRTCATLAEAALAKAAFVFFHFIFQV